MFKTFFNNRITVITTLLIVSSLAMTTFSAGSYQTGPASRILNSDLREVTKETLSDPDWIPDFLENGCELRCLIIPVHVGILTDNWIIQTSFTNKSTVSESVIAEHIIKQLNTNFRMENGKKMFHFELKGVIDRNYNSSYDGGNCEEFAKMGDGGDWLSNTSFTERTNFNSNVWLDAFEDCELLKDSNALNIFIYDMYSGVGTLAESREKTGGRGFFAKNHGYLPLILLDFERVLEDYHEDKTPAGASTQKAIAHEAGHAFGLPHVCDLNATSGSDATNLMASSKTIDIKSNYSSYNGNNGIEYECPFRGGDRSLGLNAEQVLGVLEGALQFQDEWLSPNYTKRRDFQN